MPLLCPECGVTDDEEHRLNTCKKFVEMNFSNHADAVPFDDVYSNDVAKLQAIIGRISTLWNVRKGNAAINR